MGTQVLPHNYARSTVKWPSYIEMTGMARSVFRMLDSMIHVQVSGTVQ